MCLFGVEVHTCTKKKGRHWAKKITDTRLTHSLFVFVFFFFFFSSIAPPPPPPTDSAAAYKLDRGGVLDEARAVAGRALRHHRHPCGQHRTDARAVQRHARQRSGMD